MCRYLSVGKITNFLRPAQIKRSKSHKTTCFVHRISLLCKIKFRCTTNKPSSGKSQAFTK